MSELIIKAATLLDLESGELVPGSSVRVSGERIVQVAPGRRITGDAPVLDAAGRTLMPGLIDAHVHAAVTTLDMPAMARRPSSRIGIEAAGLLEGMLRRGFTTVRDAGGLDRGVAEALDAGLIEGPRVFRSGRVISQTGGHGDFTPASDEPRLCACHIHSDWFAQVADGADAVRRAVREELKNGAHQIKIMASGGISSPTDPLDMVQYTAEEIRAAVTEAEARHTYVLAHAFTPEAIIQAVTAGVRSIEHGNLLDAAAARVMAEHGAFLVPTLVTLEQLAEVGRRWHYPQQSIDKLQHVLSEGEKAVHLALDAGVRVGFGTDLLGEAHPEQSRELLLRARVQSPLDVLRSATAVNAELLGRTGELGAVAPGALADLLLVAGNPLEDLSPLADSGAGIDLVMRGGEVVSSRIAG
ncbi:MULTISPECIES: metal-dependent hydrolase family protein [unclassified Streptomyces]|uniref:metal-dependent hydrolase family protein n=1 Tax=unclassified Streptomyces TaxID=2593676 RepID=UPI0007491794|nr:MULTISPECIES: amidohydrolase family protein [unclassified Streptomyces]KUL58725.1 peptidase M38 [Streptomyces sp. NRRL S-1521]THC51769.1 amidohydrolase family protein [Streptomyces sp. A1499]